MATATSSPPASTIPPRPVQHSDNNPGEQRIAIRNVSWDLYDQLSIAVGEGQHVYLIA
jgi:hypothetical protein